MYSPLKSKPYCVQIEPVEGCNLRCTFCGINGIRDERRVYHYMALDIVERVARELGRLGWHPRIEIAMHGEPTMHPDLVRIVREFRGHFVLLETNGLGIAKNPGLCLDLFAAGLNTLAIDEYRGIGFADRIRQYAAEGRFGDLFPIYEYPAQKEGNPHLRALGRKMVFVQPIDAATHGTHSVLNNHAGSGGPPSQHNWRCAKPFREISIRWDGNVALCCNDWRGAYHIGNVMEQPLEALWANPSFDAARRMLILGRREFIPCSRCDAKSYRPGLLPDQRGKEVLEPPDEGVFSALREAVAGAPYTVPVLRDWENGG